MDGLRLTASYARNVRDNRTARDSYPAVSTDMFLGTVPRTNEPYSFWQDRVKLVGDYRASERVKASLGAEYDQRQRSYQEVVKTRETTLWGRVGAQAREDLSLSLKLSHAQRNPSTYGTANWNESLQNPLLRKYNLAERRRNAAALRADWTPSEKLSIGLGIDLGAHVWPLTGKIEVVDHDAVVEARATDQQCSTPTSPDRADR